MKDRLCVWSRYVNYEMWFFPRLTETTFCAIFYVEQVEIEEEEELATSRWLLESNETRGSSSSWQSWCNHPGKRNQTTRSWGSACVAFSVNWEVFEKAVCSSPFKELHPGSWCWSAAAFQGLASGVLPWCTSELIWPPHPPAGASIFSALVWFMRLFWVKYSPLNLKPTLWVLAVLPKN